MGYLFSGGHGETSFWRMEWPRDLHELVEREKHSSLAQTACSERSNSTASGHVMALQKLLGSRDGDRSAMHHGDADANEEGMQELRALVNRSAALKDNELPAAMESARKQISALESTLQELKTVARAYDTMHRLIK